MAKYTHTAATLNRKKQHGKTSDGAALSFIRNKDGSLTAWQRVNGKDVRVAAPVMGPVTEDWLKEIRDKAWQIKQGLLVVEEVSPAKEKKTFETLWAEYLGATNKWAEVTLKKYDSRMLRWIAPTDLWQMPLDEVTPKDVEKALEMVHKEKAGLAVCILLDLRRVMDWAVLRGEMTSNPARQYKEALSAVRSPFEYKSHPAIINTRGLGELLLKLDQSPLNPSARAMIATQAFTCQRSGEIAPARWEEIDLDRGWWTIPRGRMKEKDRTHDQVVKLHPYLLDLFKGLPKDSEWVFPSTRDKSKHTLKELISHGLTRIGYAGLHTGHGWRSSLRTLANDAADDDGRPLFSHRWVEDVLDHKVAGVEGHYTRAKAIDGMARVLLWWGDQLVAAKEEAKR